VQEALRVAVAGDVVPEAARRALVMRHPALRQHDRSRKATAFAQAGQLIQCALASMALQDVLEIQTATVAAADLVVLVTPVVAVLEVTQMAIQSQVHAAAQATGVATLIAGASGLVGKQLLALLLADHACREVHSLVRTPTALAHTKLHSHVIEFAKLGTASVQAVALPRIDEVYICLGTTIKIAGSQEAFRAVDFDAVLAVARAGIAQGATKIGVISAMGANAKSGVFYSRVKGEMEEAVSKLGYQSVTIARPSFLAGDRESLQQVSRPAEGFALAAMRLINPIIPANYRSVDAADVASALLRTVRAGSAGVHTLLSAQLLR
jgi:uncharacterized protein YbjT (DUF2867 family)